MTKQDYINNIAHWVNKYKTQYGIYVSSPIIAQACLESGYGTSTLAYRYNNHFGLKCGSNWTGDSINLNTMEEYNNNLIKIRDNFRVFKSMEDGVKGYFEFIQYSRYYNLRGITNPYEYLETIKNDGYCTSSTYVASCKAIIDIYHLTDYDTYIRDIRIGLNYRLTANMNVRTEPNINSPLMPFDLLTDDGRAHALHPNTSILKKGTVVTVLSIKITDNYTWCRVPSGWVCFKENDTLYYEEV